MSQRGDLFINNLLCFLSSAKEDHTKESLTEVAYSFYSHEEIKNAKVDLTTLLKKDLSWRRDPEKKRKDMLDVIEFHEELCSSKSNVKFVSDTYKKMPPVGMELIAPVLTNLVEEVAKINELLPKILDIKTEVSNSADTVRQLRIDINDIKSKFSDAVTGLKEASIDLVDEDINILENIRSFRKSFGGPADPITNNIDIGNMDMFPSLSPTTLPEVGATGGSNLSSEVTRRSTGAITKKNPSKEQMNAVEQSPLKKQHQSDEGDVGEGPWSVVGEKERRQRQERRLRKERTVGPTISRVTGSRKASHQLRAVKRTADVFLGRIDNEVSSDDIKQYVSENFEVTLSDIKELSIKTDQYKAFKLSMSLGEREKVFNSELWPEGVIIDKFYNRTRKE